MDEVIRDLMTAFRAEEDLTDHSESELFECYAAHCVLHQFHEEDFHSDAHRTGGANDLGIDAWGIVINGNLYHDLDGVKTAVEKIRHMNVTVIAIQAKTSNSFESKVLSDLADNLKQVCGGGEIRFDASDEIREFQAALHAIYGKHQFNEINSPKLEVRYVTCGPKANSQLEEKCRSAEETLTSLKRFAQVRFACIDADELQDLHKLANRRVRADFVWTNRSGLPSMEGVHSAYIGSMPANKFVSNILSDQNGNIRNFLFEENLRSYLGVENPVNSGIKHTIESPLKRAQFAVLNNGITIIARSFSETSQECHMSDFQIVNGCQTGHVLYECRDQLTDDVHVKLTVIETNDESIVDSIVTATNQQTSIPPEQLAANEKIHLSIESYFRSTKAPRDLYYERRPHQYDGEPSVAKTRIITLRHLAQSYASVFLNLSHRSSRPNELLRDKNVKLYRSDDLPINYYAAASIWYQVEWLFRNQRIDKRWKPARFLIMAGLRQMLIGTHSLPQSPRKAKSHLEPLLSAVWDRSRAEQMVSSLVPLLEQVHKEHSFGNFREQVRNKTFADRFLELCSSRSR